MREKLKIVPLDALPDVLNMYIWVVGEVDMILSPGFFFLALIVWTLRCHLLEQFYSLQVHTRDRYKLVLIENAHLCVDLEVHFQITRDLLILL